MSRVFGKTVSAVPGRCVCRQIQLMQAIWPYAASVPGGREAGAASSDQPAEQRWSQEHSKGFTV